MRINFAQSLTSASQRIGTVFPILAIWNGSAQTEQDVSPTPSPIPMTPSSQVVVGGTSLQLLLEKYFTSPNLPLAQDAPTDKRWVMGFLPNENVYRIRVAPGYAAWSTLGVELTPPFRVETSVKVLVDLDKSPQGYAGLLGRYQDELNFYLFTIDSGGESQLQLHQNGQWITVTEWLPTYAVNQGGEENILAIEDEGEFLRFYVNGAPIHEITPLLPPGAVGLIGGTRDTTKAAESNFQWIRVYGNSP